MLTATINTALSLKFQKQQQQKKEMGLLSVLKYSVKYLQVFGVWYQGSVVYLYIVKVSCPVTDSVCREVNVFPTLESLHRK